MSDERLIPPEEVVTHYKLLRQDVYRDMQAEIERLTRDLGEARTAAKWLYTWVDESMWTHFDNEDLEVLAKWPWITVGAGGK